MASLRVHAPAKINLGLELMSLRPDGYHEIATLLQAITLADTIEISLEDEPGVRVDVRFEGMIAVDLGPSNANLAARAAERLPAGHGPRGVKIVLTKRIPVGAGLGGGSADAAAVLIGLDALRELGLGPDTLRAHATALGSDVPFFLDGGTQIASGRGEILRRVSPAPARDLVVIYPHVICSTAEVYAAAEVPPTPTGVLTRVVGAPLPRGFWRSALPSLRNDLGTVVSARHPEIAELLAGAERLGSEFVRVSGSGSSVFAFAPDRSTAREWAAGFAGQGHWARAVRFARGGCRIVRRPAERVAVADARRRNS